MWSREVPPKTKETTVVNELFSLGSLFLPFPPSEDYIGVLFVYDVSLFKGHPEVEIEGRIF